MVYIAADIMAVGYLLHCSYKIHVASSSWLLMEQAAPWKGIGQEEEGKGKGKEGRGSDWLL